MRCFATFAFSFAVLWSVCRGEEPPSDPATSPIDVSTSTPEADAAVRRALESPVTTDVPPDTIGSLIPLIRSYNIEAMFEAKASRTPESAPILPCQG